MLWPRQASEYISDFVFDEPRSTSLFSYGWGWHKSFPSKTVWWKWLSFFLDDSGRKISNQLFFVAFCCQAAWTNVKSPCIPEKGPEGLRKSMVHHKPWAVIFVRVVFPHTKTKVVVFCCFQIETITLLGSNISYPTKRKRKIIFPATIQGDMWSFPRWEQLNFFCDQKDTGRWTAGTYKSTHPFVLKKKKDLPQNLHGVTWSSSP